MEELKKQAHKEFDEQATWEKFGRLTSDKQKIFVKSFIDSIIDKTVQHEQERIVGLIEPLKVNTLCGWNGKEWHARQMLNKKIDEAISLITNKSDINSNK